MSPETREWLESLLESGNPVERAHAAARLAMPDEIEPPAPALAPLANAIRAMRHGFRRCFYSSHDGCGCTGTHCYSLGRVVVLADCIECLESDSNADVAG